MNSTAHTALKYSLLVLVLIGLAYGYQVYHTDQLIKSVSPTSMLLPNSSTSSLKAMILQKMGSTTQDNLKSHFAFVASNSVQTDTVGIVSCSAIPAVSSMKRGTNVTFKNADNATRTIAFSPKQTFTLAPNATKSMKASFGVGAPGLYGFTCDKSAGFAGMVLILN